MHIQSQSSVFEIWIGLEKTCYTRYVTVAVWTAVRIGVIHSPGTTYTLITFVAHHVIFAATFTRILQKVHSRSIRPFKFEVDIVAAAVIILHYVYSSATTLAILLVVPVVMKLLEYSPGCKIYRSLSFLWYHSYTANSQNLHRLHVCNIPAYRRHISSPSSTSCKHTGQWYRHKWSLKWSNKHYLRQIG